MVTKETFPENISQNTATDLLECCLNNWKCNLCFLPNTFGKKKIIVHMLKNMAVITDAVLQIVVQRYLVLW